MLKNQKKLHSYIKNLLNELNSDGIHEYFSNKLELNHLMDSILNTELLIPVIGAFSSGKSSLLNSFLGKIYLPVDITPETALATELHYSSNEFIEAVKIDNTYDKYSIDEVDKIMKNSDEYKFIKVFLNNNKLQSIKPLVLVDMPGFDSPLDLHNQAIIEYINKGVHYIVLISVEDGNITRSMVRQLTDIQEYGRNFSFFLSKSNLKAESDIIKIAAIIEKQLNDFFNIHDRIIAIDDNGGKSLNTILEKIDPEIIFENLFLSDLIDNYYKIIDNIDTAILALQHEKEVNESIIAELKLGVDNLINKRDLMLADANKKYGEININKIVDLVGRDIGDSIDELISTALSNGLPAFSQSITEIVRYSLIKNVKATIEIITNNIIDECYNNLSKLNNIQSLYINNDKWLEKITNSIKELFNKTQSGMNGNLYTPKEKRDLNAIYDVIVTVLAITTNIINPLLEIVIIFLPEVLTSIFDSIQKHRQKEKLRNTILTQIIPSIKRELRNKLPDIFKEQIQSLITNISTEFESRLQEKREILLTTEKDKSNQLFNIQKQKDKYRLIRDNITSLANNTFLKEIAKI